MLLLLLLSGSLSLRFTDRRYPALMNNSPPWSTRTEPEAGRGGSMTLPPGYTSWQSGHHSNTFPIRSYNPHGFGAAFPSGCQFKLAPGFLIRLPARNPNRFRQKPYNLRRILRASEQMRVPDQGTIQPRRNSPADFLDLLHLPVRAVKPTRNAPGGVA